MSIFAVILAANLAAPSTAVRNVDISTVRANRWIGISITVEAWSKQDVSVDATGNAKDVTPKIERTGPTTRVVAVYTGPRHSSFLRWFGMGPPPAHWIVHVPATSAVRVRTVNGGIAVRGVRTPLDLTTTNGGISVHGSGPNVVAHTTNGGIDVAMARSSGTPELDLDTTNGNIDLRVSPDFHTRVEARTSNGSIANPFARAPGPGRAILHTSNGGIDVKVE